MNKIGIDQMHFYTSDYYLNLEDYAKHKGEDPDKFYKGIGQELMAIIPPDEDIVTLAANAALPLFENTKKDEITTLLFATESSIDQSKSAGIYVQDLLGLSRHCRNVELKQACYSGTAALQMAIGLIKQNSKEKVLIICSDISRYDLDTPGESTQGCGAIAMIISENPKLVEIESGSGIYAEDVMDFWRPNYRNSALVDGKLSAKIYIRALKHAWKHFQSTSKKLIDDINYFCYHLPFSKMAEKAHRQLLRFNCKVLDKETIEHDIGLSQIYNRIIGNSYTASLYISLASLLDNAKEDLSFKRIGFFSYGSGCVSEFFTGCVLASYKDSIKASSHLHRLKNRIQLTYDEYLNFYNFQLPTDGSEMLISKRYTKGNFRLCGIRNHQRIYEVINI
ncbi:MAG: hydroxymethylglutaryl-CoA synthase [Candidatus Electrothrix sp. AR3]|nr:hydroxymethylglutaryl-CoA synthase [Candidatus Electrothrix sp. AR3]